MMKIVKLFLFILGLASSASGFIVAATRAVGKPGPSFSFVKKAPAKKSGGTKGDPAKKEWRWVGRDRDSKAPPLFLTTLYKGPKSIGTYRELTPYEDKDKVKRNPYRNNSPIV